MECQWQVVLETVNKTSSGKSSLLLIITYLLPFSFFDLPGFAPNSMKHNFQNSWKSLSLTVERALGGDSIRGATTNIV